MTDEFFRLILWNKLLSIGIDFIYNFY